MKAAVLHSPVNCGDQRSNCARRFSTVFSEPEKLRWPGTYTYNLWSGGLGKTYVHGKLGNLTDEIEGYKHSLTRRDKTKYFAKSIIVRRRNIRIEKTVQTLRLLTMMKIIIIIPIKFIN